jgi:hypothetical protein
MSSLFVALQKCNIYQPVQHGFLHLIRIQGKLLFNINNLQSLLPSGTGVA